MNALDRRVALFLSAGAAVALAGCTPQQVSDTEKKVSDVINQVQAGVKIACAAAGKLIPTANTVFAVLASILGNTNVAISSAAMIAQAITEIAAAGCPSTPPAPTAVLKTSKGVSINFY